MTPHTETQIFVEWSNIPPTEQGWYWHWHGDLDSAPIPTSVLYSGTSKKCFVSAGQLGLDHAIDCDEYGGFWAPLPRPSTYDAPIEELKKSITRSALLRERIRPAGIHRLCSASETKHESR